MAAATTLAWVGLAISAGSAAVSYTQQRKAGKDAERSAQEQRKARAEQSAMQTQQFQNERRQQLREERIRRAQIMNSAAQTGTAGGSGEMGALGALSTNLGANMGQNQSMLQSGQLITGFNQRAADFSSMAQSHNNKASMWGNIGGLGQNMFNQAGGFKTIFSTL